MTLREYAQRAGVSYEAIRKQVNKHNEDLSDHIQRSKKTQILDDFAIEYLDQIYRISSSQYDIIDSDAPHAAEQDRSIAMLREKVIDLQQQLLDAKSQIMLLQDARHKEQEEILEAKVKYQGLINEELEKRSKTRTQIAGLEQENNTLREQLSSNDAELKRYKRTIFGLYRKE